MLDLLLEVIGEIFSLVLVRRSEASLICMMRLELRFATLHTCELTGEVQMARLVACKATTTS